MIQHLTEIQGPLVPIGDTYRSREEGPEVERAVEGRSIVASLVQGNQVAFAEQNCIPAFHFKARRVVGANLN